MRKIPLKLRRFLDCRLISTIFFCIVLNIAAQENSIAKISEVLVSKTDIFYEFNFVIVNIVSDVFAKT